MSDYFGGTTGADGSNTYEDGECKHGMTKAYCADCRGLSLSTEPDWSAEYRFAAKFDSSCARCEGDIEVGDPVAKVDGFELYIHESCVKPVTRRGSVGLR